MILLVTQPLTVTKIVITAHCQGYSNLRMSGLERWMSSGRYEESADNAAAAEQNQGNAEPQVAAPVAVVQPSASLCRAVRASTLAARTDKRTVELLPPEDAHQVLPHLSASPPPHTTTTCFPTAAPHLVHLPTLPIGTGKLAPREI